MISGSDKRPADYAPFTRRQGILIVAGLVSLIALSATRLAVRLMCNLYNVTTTAEALRQFVRSIRDLSGHNQPSLDVYPNYRAPVLRTGQDGERELVSLQWGMPTPPDRVKGKADRGTSNIRNPQFGHWRPYLGIEHRCLVPATSFAEPTPRRQGSGDRYSAELLVRAG